MNRPKLARAASRSVLLVPPVALVAAAVVYDAALLLVAPWLLAVLWVVTRSGSVLRDSTSRSMADEALRRLAVR